MLSEYKITRLHPDYNFKSFDCGDADLNEFLLKDSINHYNQLLCTTFLIEKDTEIIGFFSLLNDTISVKEVTGKNKFLRVIPNSKRSYNYFPAVKLGRLGVCKTQQNAGLGSEILNFIKILFTTNNRTGCRYITVDAYQKSIKFYQKNYFDFLTDKDQKKQNRLMYFDLITIVNSMKAEEDKHIYDHISEMRKEN